MFSGKISAFVAHISFHWHCCSGMMTHDVSGRRQGKDWILPIEAPEQSRLLMTSHDYSYLFINLDRPWPPWILFDVISPPTKNKTGSAVSPERGSSRRELSHLRTSENQNGGELPVAFLWPLRLTYPCKARWQRREWIGKLGMRSFGCWSKDHCPLLLFQWLTKAVLLGMGPRPSGNVVTCWLTCLFHYFWELWMLWSCKVI
jgi:hypothetical protein